MNQSKRLVAGYAAYALLAAALILLSSVFAYHNQGDFGRATGFFFADYEEYTPFRAFRFHIMEPHLDARAFNSSILMFGLGAWLQSFYSDHFDILTFSYLAKLVLVIECALFGALAAKAADLTKLQGVAIAASLAVIVFLPHNAAFLTTLYTEYALILALPALVALLMVGAQDWRHALLVSLLAAIAGAAKSQFFYVPTLVAFCLIVGWWLARERIRKRFLLMLLLAQALALGPITANQFAKINYYHSTFLGSYMAASEETLDKIGLPHDIRECIGVDVWDGKWRTMGQAKLETEPGLNCFARVNQSFSDTLQVYLHEPGAFIRLLFEALPPHFTVNYFHLDRTYPYLYPIPEQGFGWSEWMLALTDFRDWIGPALVPVLIAASVLLALFSYKAAPMRVSALFLSAFAVSQVVVALLGEGVRDLSKHLAGAQYAVDILVVVAALQILLALRQKSAGASHQAKRPVRDGEIPT